MHLMNKWLHKFYDCLFLFLFHFLNSPAHILAFCLGVENVAHPVEHVLLNNLVPIHGTVT
uniref:Uncharacterized protein n=1 Tax=Rhizophora mucronata TaxID=61149 RepID=A0A2P2NGG7_RHIMU